MHKYEVSVLIATCNRAVPAGHIAGDGLIAAAGGVQPENVGRVLTGGDSFRKQDLVRGLLAARGALRQFGYVNVARIGDLSAMDGQQVLPGGQQPVWGGRDGADGSPTRHSQ